MLAVVAIFALMAAFVMPNLGTLGSRTLQHQAERIGGQLELARQRSIVTGIPHRLWLDLDGASYRLEWYVSEAETEGEKEVESPDTGVRREAAAHDRSLTGFSRGDAQPGRPHPPF